MYNNQYNPYYLQNGYNYMQQFQQPTYQPQQNAQYLQNAGQNVNSTQQSTQILTANKQLQGKMVDSVDVVKTIEIPLDGSVSYFPTVDGSTIITKQIGMDGKSKLTVFKAMQEENNDKPIITLEELKNSIDELKNRDNSDIIQMIEELKKEIKKKSDK